MSLTKEILADKIEVVTGQDDEGNSVTCVQVRTTTKVLEDGEVISSSYHRHVIQQGDDYSSEPANVQAVCSAVLWYLQTNRGYIVITIDDKTYTEDDLNEAQKIQVNRVNELQSDLAQLEMRMQELKVLINAYGSSLKESLTEEE